MSVILFIVILVVLIVGHEFGHFIVAKLSGMRVPEFGLGFPPKLWGKKIGDTLEGTSLGLEGYEFQVTGGSDYCGFPMRKDVTGPNRRRILAVKGIGLKQKAPGIRVRKTVAGNTIHPKIHQVNLKVLKEGAEKLEPPKKEEKKEEAAKPAA